MRFEYVLLLLLSIFPLIYKLWYWQQVFVEQWKSISQFYSYLISKQAKNSYTHFWTILEIPVLLVCIIPILDPPFEYLFYSMFFYFLILYNIFIFWKIWRKKIHLPNKNIFSLILWLIISMTLMIPIIYPITIYLFISWALLSIPIYIIVTQYIISQVYKCYNH